MATTKCLLAVGNLENIVANGLIMDNGSNPDRLIHGTSLGSENFKVQVLNIEANHESEQLPIPSGDEMTLLSHALKSFIAWPKSLVIYEKEVKMLHIILDEHVIQIQKKHEHFFFQLLKKNSLDSHKYIHNLDMFQV